MIKIVKETLGKIIKSTLGLCNIDENTEKISEKNGGIKTNKNLNGEGISDWTIVKSRSQKGISSGIVGNDKIENGKIRAAEMKKQLYISSLHSSTSINDFAAFL